MDSIRDILGRLDAIAEDIGPEQRAVKQLPALFKPKNTSPQLVGKYPGDNATRGYLVGEGEDEVKDIKAKIRELEAEQEENEYGSLAYDSVDAELQFLYAKLEKAKKNVVDEDEDQATMEGDVVSMTRAGTYDVKDREDYLDKRDVLFRALSQDPDPETRAAIKKRLTDLELAARNAGVVKEASDSNNPMRDAVIGRISRGRMDLIEKYGLTAVMAAVDDVTDGDTDWEEIGSSDVSSYVKYVEDYLKERFGSRNEISEGATTEDVISAVKKKLGDYLQDVATAIKTDPDLKDKLPQTVDQIKAVKTITTDDGHEIKIHGNEDDGFRISIKNKDLKTPFKSLDEATMACEMYCARRRTALEHADYIEEQRP